MYIIDFLALGWTPMETIAWMSPFHYYPGAVGAGRRRADMARNLGILFAARRRDDRRRVLAVPAPGPLAHGSRGHGGSIRRFGQAVPSVADPWLRAVPSGLCAVRAGIIVPMDVLQHAPALTAAEAADLGRRLFGVEADAAPLPSERDQNFLLLTAAGDRFVLKIANSTDDRALLEAQNAALAHVARGSTLCPARHPDASTAATIAA